MRRRLHDRNKNSLRLLPYVAIAVLCVLPAMPMRNVLAAVADLALFMEVLVLRGTNGPSDFGPDLRASKPVN